MPKTTPYALYLCTCSSRAEGDKIARALLEARLVACVNVLPGVTSHYWWQGKIDCAEECILFIKSLKSKGEAIQKAVQGLHSYDVPEVIELPIAGGLPAYLNWIDASINEEESC